MADIELVIKISEEKFNAIKSDLYNTFPAEMKEYGLEAIRNGILLPKHGDLIDRDDLLADSYCIDDWSGNEINIVDVMTVKMADTIIKANKESENNNT